MIRRLYLSLLLAVWTALCNCTSDLTALPNLETQVEASNNIPASELSSLQSLYNSTDGDNWDWERSMAHHGNKWVFNESSNPCLQDWLGVLCTLSPTHGYLHVEKLSLPGTKLVGTIPPEIAELPYLASLNLSFNSILGAIPDSMGELKVLCYLDLENNKISGPIPSSLANASKLHTLRLSDNDLTGTLPPSLGHLTTLQRFIMKNNDIVGPIPSTYGDLRALTRLDLSYNKLTGPLPVSMSKLSNLTTLLLPSNQFTGAILPAYIELKSLETLLLDFNDLEGNIPIGFGALPKLRTFSVSECALTGRIPADLFLAPALRVLNLRKNQLDGTIPSEIQLAARLEEVDFSENLLTGTVPLNFRVPNNVSFLFLQNNLLSGSLTSDVKTLHCVQTLVLSYNQLTGTLPDALGELRELIYLKLSHCQFRGSVPKTLGDLTELGYLFLQGNQLSGTLPSGLAKLKRLAFLTAFDNNLGGTLSSVFNATHQRKLRVIQLDENQLTGIIPDELFRLPALKTVTFDNNCFHGSIPQTICGAQKLQTLSFNGLRSGSPCEKILFPSISSAYVLTRDITNGIPSCAFSLPVLNTLHLSGNGMGGSLPDNVAISGFLIDVSLSHNRLTGTIPRAFQERVWYNLDLSYNKLRGTLVGALRTVPTNASVFQVLGISKNAATPLPAFTVQNNRLSKKVPQILQSLKNISVLSGNLFNCDLDRDDLPQNDDGRFAYSCGSNSFTLAYGVYLSIVFASVCAVCALYYWRDKVHAHLDVLATIAAIRQWLSFGELYRQNEKTGMPFMANFNYVILLLDELCKLALYSTLYIVVVMLPLFAILNAYYRTHEETYAWSVSAAYLSGVTALVLMMFFTGALVLAFLFAFRLLIEKMKEAKRGRLSKMRPVSIMLPPTRHSQFRDFAVYAAYGVVNITVLSGVNVAFVLATLKAGQFHQTLAQLALSLFKLMWSAFGSQSLIRRALRRLSTKRTNSTFFAVQLFVALFNAIIVPSVVVAVINPDCFNNAFVDAPDVVSSFTFTDCGIASKEGCLRQSRETVQLYFKPPFTYSYECSSSLITSYAPTFVYMGLMATFGNPLIDEARRYLYTTATRGTRWHRVVSSCVSRILRPVSAETVQYDAPYLIHRPYFDANYFLLSILTYLGILLTYGVVFPPLAVVMLVTIVSTTYMARMHVGRFLSQSVAAGVEKYVELINNECVGAGTISKLYRSGRFLVFIACCFYPLFMFDTLGDHIGADQAWVVFIVMPLLPVIVFGSIDAGAYYSGKIANFRDRLNSVDSVELRSMGSSFGLTMAPLWSSDSIFSSSMSAPSATSSGRNEQSSGEAAAGSQAVVEEDSEA